MSPALITILSTTHGQGFGAEAVLVSLLQGWSGAGEGLTVVAPPASRVADAARDARLPLVPLHSRRDAMAYNLAALRAAKPQWRASSLVHAWHARGFELAAMASRSLGVPATGTQHDHPAASSHGHLRRLVMRRSANRFAGLACVSDAVAGACGASGYRCPLRVIRNGLPGPAPAPAPPASPRGSRPVTIGFLGMYAPWKGFSIVNRWAERLADGAARWHLYGAVAPALRAQAEQLAAASGGRVVLRGFQREDTIFAEIDILVHASLEFDPLPTVLIEAARAGIPCVAASRGGAAEIVDDGVTGLLFDPAAPDAGLAGLERLVADTGLRVRLGAAARQRFEREFQVQRMVRDYAAFWSGAAQGANNPMDSSCPSLPA